MFIFIISHLFCIIKGIIYLLLIFSVILPIWTVLLFDFIIRILITKDC